MRFSLGSARLSPFLVAAAWSAVLVFSGLPTAVGAAAVADTHELSLAACLEMALANNRRRPASRYAVEMAEAQHRQALAAYWPQISAQAGYQRADSDPNYVFPSYTFSLPMGGTIPIEIPGIGSVPVGSIAVPEQDIKLMDRDSYRAELRADLLVYDGGMRAGVREQTGGNLEMMRQEARRTDLEVMDSVRRFYHGAVLARQLHQLGKDSLARMEATLRLTETMYKEGAGAVKKTDWLDNKVMVESLRGIVALLEKNELIARAALANAVGLPWQASVRPADASLSFAPFPVQLDALVGSAYAFSPDWSKVEAALRAAEGSVRSAESGHLPKVVVTGELHRWWNDYDAGMATRENKKGWTVGVGVQVPIFDGFLTSNRVAESRARLARINEERLLLQEGIGLQIRDIVLGLEAAEKAHDASLRAMNAAVENRDLNTRAYQHGLVETEKVIRAQLMEAFMSAQHYRALYEHLALQSRLDLVVGGEVLKVLAGR